MSDPHGRFLAWLLDGAQGEPPRDLAVHAALCGTCMDWAAAHDALHRIDVGRAPLPPWHPAVVKRPAGILQLGRTAAAAASVLLVGGAIALGASQILAGRAGKGSEPTGGVLAASGSPEPSAPTASDRPSGSASASELPSPTPRLTLTEPPATAYPAFLGTPIPSASIGPGSTKPVQPSTVSTATPTATPAITVTPTPSPIPTPVDTPTPTPTPLAS